MAPNLAAAPSDPVRISERPPTSPTNGSAVNARPTELRFLTMFRFGAALWVLVMHFCGLFRVEAVAPITHIISNGFYAMSFFFVLSGVVLAYNYAHLGNSAADLKRFYLARFARIYPVYALIHVIGLFTLSTPAGDWVRWAYTHALSALGIQSWVPQAFLGANTGTWSISCEFFFYLCFPAVLPLVRHLSGPSARARAIVYLSLFIGFLGLADFAYSGQNTFPLFYISPLFRVPEFILGMVVGCTLLARDRTRALPGWLVWLAGAVFLAVSCNSIYRVGVPTRANLILVPAVAWLIYAAAAYELSHRGVARARPWRVLEYLGHASYSIFLAQLPFIALLQIKAGPNSWLASILMPHHVASMFCFVGLSIVAGIILHELVEKPARTFILHRAQRVSA